MSFINSAPYLVDLGHRQEIMPECGREVSEPVENKMISESNNVKKSTEVEILSNFYGGLQEGMRIEIDLNRILQILPRNRRRADAYKGLRAELKSQGVELIITSKRHKKPNNI